MKKIIAFLLIVTCLLPCLTGCKKEEVKTGWDDPDQYVDILEETKSEEKIDLNLTGELYTEENKPENSIEITLFDCHPKALKVKKYKSYAIQEDIKIQYLLDIIEAFSANNTIELKGKIIGDTATVNIESQYALLSWLANDYPENFYLYNPNIAENQTDVQFNADGFAMVAMEIIEKTLKANLDINTVIFKTNNDESFFTLTDKCRIQDGIFFSPEGFPKYMGSEYNYYGDKSFTKLIEEFAQSNPKIKEKTVEEQLKIINNSL